MLIIFILWNILTIEGLDGNMLWNSAKTTFLTSEIKWPFGYKNVLFTAKYEF